MGRTRSTDNGSRNCRLTRWSTGKVRATLGALAAHRGIAASALSLTAMSLLAGCGSQIVKGEPQNTFEPKGKYPVRVLSATFPHVQKLAKDSSMQIVVRNAGSKSVPNINVTVKCGSGIEDSFNRATSSTSGSGKPARPNFVVDKIPTPTARLNPPLDPSPLERSSAFVNTYPLGTLAPGRTAVFRWDVSAVKAGPYRFCWKVNAGLYGGPKAVLASGSPLGLSGEFKGAVSNKAPQARVAADGKTVISGSGQ